MDKKTFFRVLGLDPAGDGSNKFVGYLWEHSDEEGDQVELLIEDSSPMTPRRAKRMGQHIRQIWLAYELSGIGVDEVGLGYFFPTVLELSNIDTKFVHTFAANAEPTGPEREKYKNLGTQAATEMMHRFELGAEFARDETHAPGTGKPGDRLLLPNNPQLRKQLKGREFKITPDDQLMLEPKDKLDESPDHFDGIVIAYWTLQEVREFHRYHTWLAKRGGYGDADRYMTLRHMQAQQRENAIRREINGRGNPNNRQFYGHTAAL